MQDHHGAVLPRSRVVWGWVEFAATVVAISAVVGLIGQWASIYVVLGGVADPPSAHELLVYDVTMGVAATALAAALTSAFLLGHRIALAVHVVGALVAVAVLVVLAVPADRWQPEPSRNPLPADYQPCFSGSNECN